MYNLHEEFEYENLCHLNLLAENYIMHPKHIYWMFQDLHVVQCILLDILLKKNKNNCIKKYSNKPGEGAKVQQLVLHRSLRTTALVNRQPTSPTVLQLSHTVKKSG